MSNFEAFLTPGTILKSLCKGGGKYGMYCSVSSSEDNFDVDEMLKAVPWMAKPSHQEEALSLWYNGQGFFLFNSKREMEDAYWKTIGDDGPSSTNSYCGPVRVYALTCYSDGCLMNENT